MPLTPGDKLGLYEIIAPLGAGGMGEVYRARDSKLNRDVAIKVLPAAFANDAQYMARFEREAQVLASARSPYRRRCRSRGRSPRGWRRRTIAASCTATSSPPT
jgi:serine/threonine protein kinase